MARRQRLYRGVPDSSAKSPLTDDEMHVAEEWAGDTPRALTVQLFIHDEMQHYWRNMPKGMWEWHHCLYEPVIEGILNAHALSTLPSPITNVGLLTIDQYDSYKNAMDGYQEALCDTLRMLRCPRVFRTAREMETFEKMQRFSFSVLFNPYDITKRGLPDGQWKHRGIISD